MQEKRPFPYFLLKFAILSQICLLYLWYVPYLMATYIVRKEKKSMTKLKELCQVL